MAKLYRIFLALSGFMIALGAAFLASGRASGAAVLIGGLVSLAIGLGERQSVAPFRFTAWMVAGIALAMFYPQLLLDLRLLGYSIDLQNSWLKLLMVQGVMFGMGTQMRLADIAGVVRTPLRVVVGLVCQFTIMPLVGLGLALALQLPDEIAAGVVLIGCCSSGLASNVMVHLARGDLALSVTLTAVATLMAPVVTPTWMKLLAGQFVPVNFVNMMLTIIKIMIVPIAAAMLHDVLIAAPQKTRKTIFTIGALAAAWLLLLVFGGWQWFESRVGEQSNILEVVTLLNYLLGAIAAGVTYHLAIQRYPRLHDWMPVISMIGILYFTTITVADGRDQLIDLSGVLLIAAVLHNTLGYLFGYTLSRAVGMDVSGARTIAIEVGMQNGAMGVTLADAMGKMATVGLAPILFSPWMNVSGSLLANYWRRRPTGVASTESLEVEGELHEIHS
ncbi:bile acid:sodium symporter family protein [Aeoliella sp.]|uniref:bile acid:sodium symporter family protein n=1 Tax=Aeoliella sp. TaxID=2795800 RepID=UPI003CCBDCD0